MTQQKNEIELHNREAEEAVIGSVLINPDTFPTLKTILEETDFHIRRHGMVWKAYKALHDAKTPIDYVTLTQELRTQGTLGEVDYNGFLVGLMNQVPTSFHAEAYAQVVKDYAGRRAWIRYASQVAHIAADETKTDWIDKAKNVTRPIGDGPSVVRTVDEIAVDVLASLTNQRAAIPCHTLIKDPAGDRILGVPALTEKLGGLPYGEAVILAAPTQTGKTTLAYLLGEVAVLLGKKVLYVSTESTGKMLVTRRMMGNLGISVKLLRKNELTELQIQDIQAHAYDYVLAYNGKYLFDDTSRTLSKVIRSMEQARPDLVILDHLGEMAYDNENKSIGMGENFSEMRAWCRDEGTALLCVHQIDLTVTERPQLQHLRWARGDLSEKADIALMLYRPDLALARAGDEKDLAAAIMNRTYPVPLEGWIRKDRGGPVDVLIPMMYELKNQRIRGVTFEEEKSHFS
jgi:replicative DNA helicase